uniref:RING-type domain-containing protein n=1 Tax=Aureoumbra lagunensis TaxID=44058 RepID=A0A7S3K3R0_9STRA|mmetsp:Transcript_12360/g.16661  ORF Transcript_12360/g.16661 Transcript_12360/m.16661 type:complete len:200 (+) Transcript_12360:57-656(+)
MVFVFIDSQHGLRGAMVSIGMSLGLYGINYLIEYVQISPLALIAIIFLVVVIVAYFFGQRILEHLWNDWQQNFFFSGRTTLPKNAQFDSILSRLRSTPVQIWKPAHELSVHDLRRIIIELKRGEVLEQQQIVERKDLEQFYHEIFDVCSICAEPWTSDDIYRRLSHCGHCFHLECIDKWALTMAEKRVVPSCPLCKHTF